MPKRTLWARVVRYARKLYYDIRPADPHVIGAISGLKSGRNALAALIKTEITPSKKAAYKRLLVLMDDIVYYHIVRSRFPRVPRRRKNRKMSQPV